MTDKYNLSTPFFTLSGICTIARLIDVYDGDTVTCIFPILNDNYYKFNLRLNGIDTAELKNSDLIAKHKALEARHKVLSVCCDSYNLNIDCHRDEIQDYLKQNETFVWIECYEFDKYGRILADIYKEKNGISISTLLLNANLAYKYSGGTKEKIKN